MSHFSRIKTQFKERIVLISALKELGYQVKEIGEIRGDQGLTKVDFAAVTSSGYNIGFVKDTDGTYNIVADWWGVKANKADFTSKLSEAFKEVETKLRQTYALKATLDQLKVQGFKVVNQVQAEDGTIRIQARRWS